MGRKNTQYRKTLHQQAYERLVSMQAFGSSKKEAVKADEAKDKIFSHATYEVYKKHINYFISWVKNAHPDCTTLRTAKRYVKEWLQLRTDQIDARGNHLSAWTIQTEAAALNKLFQIDKADPGRFQPPRRRREDIFRSRVDTVRDKHFSVTNNDALIKFCKGTGCRRGVLKRLEGRDYWTRERMEDEVRGLNARREDEKLTPKLEAHLACLMDALAVFPEEKDFVHHRQDKNGRYRFAPIIGPNKDQIIERFKETASNKKVWQHVHTGADIHGYRADYATRLYKLYARDIDTIPYDSFNAGIGKKYQSDVYICRRDEAGKRLDKRAMLKCSKALGHNRISVVAINYIRGL